MEGGTGRLQRGNRRVDPVVAAVDIGGTKIAVGLVNAAGKILYREDIPTQTDRGFYPVMQEVIGILHRAAGGTDLSGVGVGCTGPVDPATGVLGSVDLLPGWQGENLAGVLEEAFHLQVAVENDADAAALAESAWGAGQSARRFIYVTISTGIGVGLVFDGSLYRGAGGAHPEIGHQIINPNGPACSCGAHGCWESLASGSALGRAYAPLDARQVCQAAYQGEVWAQRAVGEVARYLGLGFANLVTVFAPDVIAVGGGLMNSRSLFWDTILETIQSHCGMVPNEQTRLVPAALGPSVGLAGAAQAWFHRFLPAF